MKVNFKNRTIYEVLLFVFLFVYPFFPAGFYVNVMTKLMLFSIFALSLDLIWGYGGLFSFGHSIFFGWGAYTTALFSFNELFTKYFNGIIVSHPIEVQSVEPNFIAIILAFLIPFLVAGIISIFLFTGKAGGISGVYFAIVTLAFTFVATQIAVSWVPIFGGFNGIPNIPGLKLASNFVVYGGKIYYFIVFGVLLCVYFLIKKLTLTGFGLLLKCVAENEQRVIFLGIKSSTVKMIIFMIAGGVAGLSGGLYAPLEGFVSPPLLGFYLATSALVWVAVGGRGTLIGPIVGAIFIGGAETLLSGLFIEFWLIIIGFILLFTILFLPSGLMGFLKNE